MVDLNKGPSSHKVLAELDLSIGTTADILGDDENFVFGGKAGYGIFDRNTAKVKYIKKYWEDDPNQAEKEKKFRGNDGAVDAQGRYWVGIMRDPLVNEPSDDGMLQT